jgi:hypothetical protein
MADSEIPVNWRGQAVLYLQNEVGLRRDKTRKSIECPILNVQKVVYRLLEVIEKAHQCYTESNKRKIVVDEEVEVVLTLGRARRRFTCSLCGNITEYSQEYKIRNIQNQAKVVLDDHALHQLNEHLYFPNDIYKVTPYALSRVLGMISPP